MNNDIEGIERELIAEPSELNLRMHYVENVKAYIHDPNSGDKEEVTNQAKWTTSNSDIVVVGNKAVKGQVASRAIEGTTKIIVSYNSQQIEITVNVFRPELEVECISRIMNNNKAEFRDIANVGETIQWVSNYPKLGAPYYIYEWSGTDGLEGSFAVAEIIYNKPGVKTAKIFTTDLVGTTAESECSITIIQP